MLDSNLLYYARIIHPDTVQLCVSLLALLVAGAHVRTGRWATLTCLGLLVGVHHGTKMGGPWIAPMALLATWWGARAAAATATAPSAARTWFSAMSRGCWLGLMALAGFFLTTPYAFFDPYYFDCIKGLRGLLLQEHIGQVTFMSWINGLETHLSKPLFIACGVAVLCVPFRSDVDGARKPLCLAAVLILGNILWYAALGRLWVMVPYYVCALSLLGLLLTDLLLRLGRLLQSRCQLPFLLQYALVVVLGTCVIYDRWCYGPLDALNMLALRHDTRIGVGVWAEQHIDPKARILYDDLAYFNPQIFTNQRMLGGVLTYTELVKLKPEYLVLSESLHGSANYTELRKTQHLKRADPEPFSMRLYQDLLNDRPDPYQLGPTGVPGIDLVEVVRADTPQTASSGENIEAPNFLVAILQRGFPAFCYQAAEVNRLACRVLGKESHRTGPTIFVYHIDPSFVLPPD
jgi:hypothetical protein